jgi:hypothetical protein
MSIPDLPWDFNQRAADNFHDCSKDRPNTNHEWRNFYGFQRPKSKDGRFQRFEPQVIEKPQPPFSRPLPGSVASRSANGTH